MSSDLSTGTSQRANGAMVSPGFFQTLGISLIRGRDFAWSDDQKHPRFAIVSSTLAKRLFPHADAFGQRIRFGLMPDLQDMEIVGCLGYNPRQSLEKNSNLARTSARYKVDVAKVGVTVRAELTKNKRTKAEAKAPKTSQNAPSRRCELVKPRTNK
jgi:hypothetical protein